MKCNRFCSTGLSYPQYVPRMVAPDHNNRPKRLLSAWTLMLFICLLGANAAFASGPGKVHKIELWAEKITVTAKGGNELYAYRMAEHIIKEGDTETDVTSRYLTEPTIPGPTLVIDVGDEVLLTLKHVFDPGNNEGFQTVSVHVHGVHYDILSDGTFELLNLVADENATPIMSYTYHWRAAPGTAGTWAYHDHSMLRPIGAEDKGLFGAVIVNDHDDIETVNQGGKTKTSDFSTIDKEYVLFFGDDAFWGEEIDNRTGQQTPLWDNPTLSAEKNSNVRFHVISLGTDMHEFQLPGYQWIDPGTNQAIKNKILGPLEKHVFAVKAKPSSVYKDLAFAGQSLGIKGKFKVEK